MTIVLIATVVAGVVAGRFIVPSAVIPHLDQVAMGLLYLVLLGIGMEMGATGTWLGRLKKLQPRALLLPLTSAIGSLLASVLVAIPLGMDLFAGLSIGAGFGWYSLSSVMLADLAGAQLGALAFLTNVLRELIAIISIPILTRWGFGAAAITPGGATTMDTTLAVVSRVSDEETTILSFFHGLVLSMMVPILVAFFAKRIVG